MKTLILSDIHSNWPALQAIQESFDACLFLGDLVDYGSDPVPCIDWIREHADAAVRGNHDHAIAQRIPASGQRGLSRLAAQVRPHHWQVLDAQRMKFLARMPVTRRLELAGSTFYLVHATPRDPFDEYLRDDPESWKDRLKNIDADFVCVGHSHMPFCVEVGETRVVNPGSVGQPRDGDPRAAYCVIEDGNIEFRRVEYDIEATIRHLAETGLNGEILEMTAHFLRTGGRMAPGIGAGEML